MMEPTPAKNKEYLQAAAVFLLFIAIFFHPLFYGRVISQADVTFFWPPWTATKPPDLSAPSNPVLNDQTREFLTFFRIARESFERREAPLWNPYIMGGTPLLANSQSALLFPLNWPFYFLPFHLGFTLSALLKMLVASLATYAFARRVSLSHLAGIMAGTAYAFSAFNVFWLNHPHTNVTLFFPLLLLLAENIVRSPSLRSMAMLGLAVGLQLLGGHVEIAFHIAAAVTLFFLFRSIVYRKDGRALFLSVKVFVGGYTLGFLLAGILMAPFLEFLAQSATWHVRSETNPFFLAPVGLISMVLSNFFIAPPWPVDVSGYHSLSLYAGIAPLILSVVSLVCVRHRVVSFFAGLSFVALLIVFRVPPFFSLLTSLPLFKQTPNYYMVLFHIFGVSLMGGLGVHLITAAETCDTLRARLRKVLVTIAVILPLFAAGLLLLVTQTSFLSPVMKGVEGLSAPALGRILYQIGADCVRSALFAGLTFTLLGAVCLVRWPKQMLASLVVFVTFVDLFIAGSGWNPTIPAQRAKVPPAPAVDFLRQDKDVYRVAGIGSVMPPNTASLAGFHDIRGYDVPVTDRYHAFFQKALKGRPEWWIYDFPQLPEGVLDFLSLVNVKYILSVDALAPPLALVYDKEIKIYENPEVFPRAFLADRFETAESGHDALERVMSLGSQLMQLVVIEGTPPEFMTAPSVSEKGKPFEKRVQIVRYAARQVVVDVETPAPAFLILGDTYFPGWRASVDGKQVPVYRADYLLKAVAVEKGKHQVVFSFQPLSFRIGLGITLGSAVILLGGLIRRKTSPGRSSTCSGP